MPMSGANFRELETLEVLLPRIRRMRTSENAVYAKFGCAPARRVYLRRDHNTSSGYYRSLMYERLCTSDTLHKKTASPGCGWTLGANCASQFSRSPAVASRHHLQRIHATGVASVLPIGNVGPALHRPDRLRMFRRRNIDTVNFREFRLCELRDNGVLGSSP